jgi:hypothetical protein
MQTWFMPLTYLKKRDIGLPQTFIEENFIEEIISSFAWFGRGVDRGVGGQFISSFA